MVSFNCQRCQDVVKKPKVPSHAASCGSYSFSCVDCMKLFDLDSIKNHTQCVSEVQKYQGKWNKPTNKNYGPDSDDEDEEFRQKREKEKAHAAAAAAARRRPRQMNFSDTDSDDDNDKKKKEKKQPASAAPQNSAAAKNNKSKSKSPSPPRAASVKKQSPKQSPIAKPVAAPTSSKKSNKNDPVHLNFVIAHNVDEFKTLVSSVVGDSSLTVKAASKLVMEKVASSKNMRQAIQGLITEHCEVKDGHVQ